MKVLNKVSVKAILSNLAMVQLMKELEVDLVGK